MLRVPYPICVSQISNICVPYLCSLIFFDIVLPTHCYLPNTVTDTVPLLVVPEEGEIESPLVQQLRFHAKLRENQPLHLASE